MVPALLGGIEGGRRAVILIVGSEATGLMSVLVVSNSDAGALQASKWPRRGSSQVWEWVSWPSGSSGSAARLRTTGRAVVPVCASTADPAPVRDEAAVVRSGPRKHRQPGVERHRGNGRWRRGLRSSFARSPAPGLPWSIAGWTLACRWTRAGDIFERCVKQVHAVSAPQASGRADSRHRFAFRCTSATT